MALSAATNPLLMNPSLMAAMSSFPNPSLLANPEQMLNAMKQLIPQLPLAPLLAASSPFLKMPLAATVSHGEGLMNPKIADSFKSAFDTDQLTTLRSLLENVNASVTRTLLEDNLRKWAAAAAVSPADIWDTLAKAQPVPINAIHDSEDGESTVSSTKSLPRSVSLLSHLS